MNSIVADTDAFLWGYAFDDTTVRPITDQSLAQDLANPDLWIWLHMPLSDQRARGFIERLAEIPAAARQMILDVEDRVQLQFSGDWTYGVLPDLERDLDGNALGPGRLQFAAGERLLLTARRPALKVIDEVRKAIQRGALPAGPAAVIVRHVEGFVDLAEKRFDELSASLNSVEDGMIQGAAVLESVRLGPLRREVSRNHREFVALRSALHRAMSPRATHRAPAMVEHLSRLAQEVEDLDRESISLQERARLLNEEIDTRITAATNRSMRALTIMSTLLIPPTLIVGAFGMNVGGVPFGASHGGFFAASMLCLAVVGAAWWMLRRMQILS